MLLSTIDAHTRTDRLKQAVQSSKPGICTERALIWTAYFRKRKNRKKPMAIQIAEAFRDVLEKKTVAIYPDELIVGNITSKRVGGQILPELLGVPVMEDLVKFPFRRTSPLRLSIKDFLLLLSILPFWFPRFLAMRAHRSPVKKIAKLISQMKSHVYVINETGGIAHTAPDYEKLIRVGTGGIVTQARRYQRLVARGSDAWNFYEAVTVSAQAFATFCDRYGRLARDMAEKEPNPRIQQDLKDIEAVFRVAPRKGAATFRQALQIAYLAHVAIMIESLDNSIALGRMDQFLYPYYSCDIQKGLLTRQQAKDLVTAFSIKMCEVVPVFSQRVVNFHGGFYNAQVVTVGGVDRLGKDAVNDLTLIFLEVMDELRMREPNYHARIHAGSPKHYTDAIFSMLTRGANTPALYNDDVIIKTMAENGYALEDARNYTAVGCVEPISQGKSFASTNAAMVNVPLLLELALNQGRRFGSPFRTGDRTRPVTEMFSMDDVMEAFDRQLRFQIRKLMEDLHAIELANRNFHPTPFTSSLHDGCLESGTCTTAGGAVYNYSGIQGVASVATGDALYAIHQVVFVDKKATLPELTGILKSDIKDPVWQAYLPGLKKFGNDEPDVDRWTLRVVDTFLDALEGYENTRGGRYVMGIYSDTIHEFFGRIVGAMPHGRRKGEPFASGISPGNGYDVNGPTALLNSVNRIDFTKLKNGINFNLKFDPHTLRGQTGQAAFASLLKTYFRRGGMQVQTNVLSPEQLIEARNHPERHPNLLVRVSGYSVYFNDLTPVMKDEIIRRSTHRVL